MLYHSSMPLNTMPEIRFLSMRLLFPTVWMTVPVVVLAGH